MAPVAVTVITPVRVVLFVLASTETLMVPVLVPLAPEVMWTHVGPVVTAAVQAIVPPPVFVTSKVVVPASKATLREAGRTFSTGRFAACTMVTVFGLPVAPVAVTVTTPVRVALSGFASNEMPMVPVLVPLAPEVRWTHVAPVVTAAVQAIDPPPVLVTLKVVVPAVDATFLESGVTVRAGGVDPRVTVNEMVLPAVPILVISIPAGEPSLRKQEGLLVAVKDVLPDSVQKLAL